jgi:hypothetical protein
LGTVWVEAGSEMQDVTNEWIAGLGFVAEHGSRDRPVGTKARSRT